LSLEDFRDQIDSCVDCKVCNDVCSFYLLSGDEELGPWRKLDVSKRLLLNSDVSENELLKAAYACTMCGMCERVCPMNIQLTDIVRMLRRRIIRENMAPEKVKLLCENIVRSGSMTGGGREFWRSWIPSDVKLPEKSETLYLSGCMIPFKIHELGRATIDILLKAGVDFTILGEDERCCGLLLWDHGFIEEAEKLAEDNVEKFEEKGAKRLIVACSACYYMYKEVYPRLLNRRTPEVHHIVEILSHLVDEGKLVPKKRIDAKVVYFDSCHFTKFTGKYSEPRKLIQSIPGIKLLELSRNRESGYCCGISSGVRMVFKDLTDSVAKKIIREALDIGAEKIVTSCPLCMYQFMSTIKRYNIRGIEAIDIPLLLYEAL